MDDANPTADIDEPVGRRAALRRVGALAAGAVAGGTALAAASASPAAAATLTGSGNPGVVATGLGGDGVAASTDTATKSAVFGTTAVNGAFGAFFNHDGNNGTALEVLGHSSGTAGSRPAMVVRNVGSNTALRATNDVGPALSVTGGGTDGSFSYGAASISSSPGATSALDIGNGGETGISINGTGTNTAIRTSNAGRALVLQASQAHIAFQDAGTIAPEARAGTAGDLTFGGLLSGGDLWFNVSGGAGAGWRKLAGPATAGAFHVLTAPVRVYDSRAGEPPLSVTKGLLTNGTERTITCTVGGAVPTGATAVQVNLTIVGTNAAGFLSTYRFGVPFPGTSTMNWSAAGTVLANGAVVAIDGSARFVARAGGGGSTHLAVDVVGYYR